MSRGFGRRKKMNPFSYVIDIVGGCNLRCPSCPVGNSPSVPRPQGRMPIKLFRSIVEKIKMETPNTSSVALFNWTEPFLHPQLSEFVAIARDNQLSVAISTNLNICRNLNEVVRAGPERIRITVSGFTQEVYGRTHVGGNIETVKANMRKLSDALDRHRSETGVYLAYLCYVHNVGIEYDRMSALSRELGFNFRPYWAYLMPLDKYLAHYEEGLPEEDQALLDLLAVHPDEAKSIALRHMTEDCSLRSRQTAINCDGSVALCCGVYDMKHTIAKSFLDISHADLQDAKYDHALCTECMKHGLHVTAIYGGIKEWSKVAAVKLHPQKVPKELVPPSFMKRLLRKMLRTVRLE